VKDGLPSLLQSRSALAAPSHSFWQAIQTGNLKMMEAPAYIAWLHTLPCCVTGRKGKGITAHHVVGHGLKASGGKTSDYLAIPLFYDVHLPNYPNGLHALGHKEWERRHGSQLEFSTRTLLQAIYDGVLVLR
jgi:hypothetical protein